SARLSVADATRSRGSGTSCSGAFRCPLSSSDGERDVERLLPPLQQHGDAVSVLQVLGRALEVLDAPDPLAVDLADQIAPLEAGLGRRAVLLDAEDDDPLRIPQVELPGDLGRDRPDVEAEQALALVVGLERDSVLGCVADLDLERLLALVAPDLDRDPLAGGGQRDDLLQILG